MRPLNFWGDGLDMNFIKIKIKTKTKIKTTKLLGVAHLTTELYVMARYLPIWFQHQSNLWNENEMSMQL